MGGEVAAAKTPTPTLPVNGEGHSPVILVTLGTVIGLGGAVALTRVMSSMLYGLTATDARAFWFHRWC